MSAPTVVADILRETRRRRNLAEDKFVDRKFLFQSSTWYEIYCAALISCWPSSWLASVAGIRTGGINIIWGIGHGDMNLTQGHRDLMEYHPKSLCDIPGCVIMDNHHPPHSVIHRHPRLSNIIKWRSPEESQILKDLRVRVKFVLVSVGLKIITF